MKAIWNSLELLDRALFLGAEKVESLAKKKSFRSRIEKSIEDVRPPQTAIQFDN